MQVIAATRHHRVLPGFGLITVMVDHTDQWEIPELLRGRFRATGPLVTGTEDAWRCLREHDQSSTFPKSTHFLELLPTCYHIPFVRLQEWSSIPSLQGHVLPDHLAFPWPEALDKLPQLSLTSVYSYVRPAIRRMHLLITGEDPGPDIDRDVLKDSPALWHVAEWGRHHDPVYTITVCDMYYSYMTSQLFGWKSFHSMWNRA